MIEITWAMMTALIPHIVPIIGLYVLFDLTGFLIPGSHSNRG